MSRSFADSSCAQRNSIPCTSMEFLALTSVIEKRTGLTFSREKQREFSIKLEKLPPIDGIRSAEELIEGALRSEAVLQEVINVLTIGESYFFRNRPHFTALQNTIIPQLIEDTESTRSLSIWCAGCANGEEPYSIAIMLKDHFPQLASWDVSIVATDINTRFLASAKQGIFRSWSFRGVAPNLIARHFTPIGDGDYRLEEDIVNRVEFKHFNLARLADDEPPFSEPLDLLLCRNVLIYFPFQTADGLIEQFRETIRPGGYLLVGHSEAFPALGNLEVIYSSATYFYRRYLDENAPRLSAPGSTTTAIPGMAVRSSFMPRMFPSQAAAPIPRMPIPLETGSGEPTPSEMLSTAKKMANTGRTDEAVALLERLAEGPGRLDHRVHFLRAIVADHRGVVQQAAESLKRSIFLNKSFVVGHYYLGVISQREGETSTAIRHFKNVIRLLDKLPPDHPLEEAEGLSAKWLREMIGGQFEELACRRNESEE